MNDLTPCKMVMLSKELERVEVRLKELKGEVSWTATGGLWTATQRKERKALEARAEAIKKELGWMV